MKVAVIGSRGLLVENLGDYLPEGTTEIVSGGAAGAGLAGGAGAAGAGDSGAHRWQHRRTAVYYRTGCVHGRYRGHP